MNNAEQLLSKGNILILNCTEEVTPHCQFGFTVNDPIKHKTVSKDGQYNYILCLYSDIINIIYER